MKQVRLGIIGAGRIGNVHSQSVANDPAAVAVAITDINRDSAEQLASMHGISRVADTSRELLDSPDIDAVLICSSTNTHADLIVQAAQAGKHIFCEKPIDYDLARIDRSLDAVERARVKLQLGFNRRFDSNFARVKKAIETGEIGRPRLLHIISRDPGPPPISYVKSSGGMFFDMTIHDFDMARFLMGEEVEEIYTAAGVMVDPAIGNVGDVDTAMITLRFASGAIGIIDNCREAAYGYDQRVEVLGSKGSIHTGNRYPNQAIVSTGASVRRDLPLNFFMDRYAESFAVEMRSFIRAIREDTPTLVTGIDGRIPVAMGIAALRSHQEGKPVKLSTISSTTATRS
jgi:myo-inositol 2-dehydrogenase/D-chiro-inositol 1-dehydrogenase